MHVVLIIFLACATIALATFAICQSAYNLWRFRWAAAARRESAPIAQRGMVAEIVAKSALCLIEVVTILYVAVGYVPTDVLSFVGLHVPTTMNRYLLFYGTQLQVIIGTVAFILTNHAIKGCHFPRDQSRKVDPAPLAAGARKADGERLKA